MLAQFKTVVIVVTYNGIKWYDRCFGSLRKSTIPVKVIVIDNKSTDNTVEYIEKEYPEVFLVKSNKNCGFGKANNIGFEYALKEDADYVYLLNQDAWIEPETIEGLINVLKENEKRGIVSPIQCNGRGDKLDYNFQDLLKPSNCENLLSDIYFHKTERFYPVKSVMAAHWLIKMSALKKVGGFSPVFYHYGEDNNLIHRFLYHGYQVGICPHFKGYHDREFRKKTNSKRIYLQYTHLLIFSSDINKSFISNFIKYYFILIAFTVLKLGSLKDLKYLFLSLLNIFKILKYRKITKKNGPLFINGYKGIKDHN